MTEATHFSQCVHDQQRRLEAEDCDSIRYAQLISGGRRRIRPPCIVPRSRSPHNVLHSPSNWASVSEPHTCDFNATFSLYTVYDRIDAAATINFSTEFGAATIRERRLFESGVYFVRRGYRLDEKVNTSTRIVY